MGCMDRVSLERFLSQGLSLAEIGRRVGRHESTVSYWVGKHGLNANGRIRHAARGILPREDLEGLVEAGMSIAEIAREVGRGKATVRHWLRRYGLRTFGASGRRRAVESDRAKSAGWVEASMFCPKHGETSFVLDGRGYYRCRRCRSVSVSRRRRRLKQQLVSESGGACRVCGYSRCIGALEFHHLVPAEKAFSLSEEGITRSLARARAEASKCVLLCANCHAEVEAGVAQLPLRSADRPVYPA
jgi:transposase/5-methylcytosine-specific restriction endonuclease McrA